MSVKKMTLLALNIALAMILSFVESQIPPLVALPGIKMGLANIAVVFALYKFGGREAAAVSLLRVLLVGILFGNTMSLMYSAAGAALALTGMLLLRRIPALACTTVSVVGAVLHNVGQIAVACLVLETSALKYYLAPLILSGVLGGIAIGVLASVLVKRIPVKL